MLENYQKSTERHSIKMPILFNFVNWLQYFVQECTQAGFFNQNYCAFKSFRVNPCIL